MTVSRLIINGRDFHLHSAHSRAQHAASGKPFTEHCHGETVTTEAVETKRHLVLKVVAGLLAVVLVIMLANQLMLDAAAWAAEARV